jgi:hypothetical protein
MPTLSEEMIALITGLPIRGQLARAEDRRFRHRIPLPLRALLWRCGEGPGSAGTGPGLVVEARDLSGDGISIIGPAILTPGDEFILELHCASAPAIKLRYKTVRTQPMDGDQHLIAAVFQGILNAAAAPTAPAAELRGEERPGFWSRLGPPRR